MKHLPTFSAATGLVALLLCGGGAAAQGSSSDTAIEANNGIPIEQIIAAVAQKTNRKFLIDPRVQARVHLVGQQVSQVSYDNLLSILSLHGYVVSESSGYVQVLPDANARQTSQSFLTPGRAYPDAQFVDYVIPVRNGPASYLVPILRPLMPQYASLAAAYCSNSLLISDRFANIKRIESIVKTLDVGTPYKQPDKCTMPSADGHDEQPGKRHDS